MPNQIFISYPSESWNFAERIVEALEKRINEVVFIDHRGIDQADFQKAILAHLNASVGMILVVTDATFQDVHRANDWVRMEIRHALENQKQIVQACENGLLVKPSMRLPNDIKDITRSQAVPFHRGLFGAGIDSLVDLLVRIGLATLKADAGTSAIRAVPAYQTIEEILRMVVDREGGIDYAAYWMDGVVIDYANAEKMNRNILRKQIDDRPPTRQLKYRQIAVEAHRAVMGMNDLLRDLDQGVLFRVLLDVKDGGFLYHRFRSNCYLFGVTLNQQTMDDDSAERDMRDLARAIESFLVRTGQ